jgi:hypothetical protein
MKRGVAGLVACAIGLGLAASGSGDAQPRSRAKLDDDTFWKLVVELSEPSGSYPDDNYVSNELELQRVLPDLERWFSPGGVYLGVGPEQNFSYVAARRPRIAFIVDIRRQNAMEHLMYKALFELADDRADFVSLLFSRQRPPDLDARDYRNAVCRLRRQHPGSSTVRSDARVDLPQARRPAWFCAQPGRSRVDRESLHCLLRGRTEDPTSFAKVANGIPTTSRSWT